MPKNISNIHIDIFHYFHLTFYSEIISKKGHEEMKLVEIKNDQPVTSSLQVAETFGRKHKHVLESIDSVRRMDESSTNLFYDDEYVHPQNKRKFRQVYMNKDGWTLLVMGFQGTKATKFKLQYIAQFNKMEQELKQPKLVTPQNYPEALRLAADLAEENEKLKAQLNQKDFEQGVIEQIDNVLYTTEEIAEQFGYGSGQGVYAFNQMLHDLGVVYPQRMKKGYKWHLYAKYRNRGYRGLGSSKNKQKWTSKGKAFVESIINKEED